mgnify:CR=1 FL=1
MSARRNTASVVSWIPGGPALGPLAEEAFGLVRDLDHTDVAFVGVDGATFRHNTIYRPTKWVLRILQESQEPRFVRTRDAPVPLAATSRRI